MFDHGLRVHACVLCLCTGFRPPGRQTPERTHPYRHALSSHARSDVIAFWLDIPYEHPLGHRGFTHSILFAALWAIGIGYLFWRKTPDIRMVRWRIWLYLFLCTASHGVLDALTTGGRGVGFFIPLDNDRYFLPWRFIQVSPIRASAFFSEYGLQVLANEVITVWLPCTIVMIIAWMVRQWRKA